MIVDSIITIGDYCVSLISLFSLIGGFDMEYSHGTATIAVADNKEHPSNNYSIDYTFSFFNMV